MNRRSDDHAVSGIASKLASNTGHGVSDVSDLPDHLLREVTRVEGAGGVAEQGYEPTACKSKRCGSAIRWVKTVEGKRMPVDVGRDPAGPLVLVHVRGEWRARVLRADEQPAEGTPRYVPHWSTCPDANFWRGTRQEVDTTGGTSFAGRVYEVRTGPCAGCRRPDHVLYGPQGGPLCPECKAIPPAERRPYTREESTTR